MNENDDAPIDPEAPDAPAAEGEENLPPYVIEAARSSRSKCKTCRRAIEKGLLRIGVLVEGGFYGPGYMWHHLTCAAKRHLDQVEEAYEAEAWKNAAEVPAKVPSIESLRAEHEKAEEKKAQRKEFPYAEPDPSGRARCKQCNEPIEKGALRVMLAKEVTFGSQTRTNPMSVHPKCVAAALQQPDVATEADGLREALAAHSGLEPKQIDEIMAAIGPLPAAK